MRLNDLIQTFIFYEKYKTLNDTLPQRKHQKKICFSFDFIRYNKSYSIKIIIKEDLSRILILSNGKLNYLQSNDNIEG